MSTCLRRVAVFSIALLISTLAWASASAQPATAGDASAGERVERVRQLTSAVVQAAALPDPGEPFKGWEGRWRFRELGSAKRLIKGDKSARAGTVTCRLVLDGAGIACDLTPEAAGAGEPPSASEYWVIYWNATVPRYDFATFDSATPRVHNSHMTYDAATKAFSGPMGLENEALDLDQGLPTIRIQLEGADKGLVAVTMAGPGGAEIPLRKVAVERIAE